MRGGTFTRTELRWARAAFETIFPENATARLPMGIARLDVEGFLSDVRARSPLDAALGLRIAIWIVALAPIVVLRRFATIASLSRPERERVMRALLASPVYGVRQLVLLLKAIGALLYAGAAPVRTSILSSSSTPPSPELVPLRRGSHGHRSFA